MWRAIVVWSAVVALCLGVCWSALTTYHTLKQLQNDFLRNQAASIAASIEFAGRDLSSISQAEFQSKVEEIYSGNGRGLAELAVVSRDHKILAHNDSGKLGETFEGASLNELFQSKKIYEERYEVSDKEPVYQVLLPVHMGSPRNLGGEEIPDAPAFNVVAISLFVNSASFITRQGKINLLFTLSACGLLLGITAYDSLALKRSRQLEARQAREQQWVMLGRMSAALAHDMQNPLGAIKGLAQVLGENLSPEDNASSHAKTIVREAERLQKLAADLLLFARPKHAEPRTFPLKELFEDVSELFEQSFRRTGVQLKIEEESSNLRVTTDYDLLKRVLINLFENSLLAMPEGGNLFVSGNWDSNTRRCVIQVDDEGEGLPPETERVFEPFYTTRAAGSGLGLAICVQIIAERLGGTISLRNRPVRGTSCTILLPQNP